jgi:FkbM family methyltransferase
MQTKNLRVFALLVILAIALCVLIAQHRYQLKTFIASGPIGTAYVKYWRDGKDFDADHLITTLDNGMKIIVNKHDNAVCLSIRTTGHWDHAEKKVIDKLIKPGFNVVEVGANFGALTLQMAGLVGEHGNIYAFEANPNVSKYLKQSVSMNHLDDRIHVFEMAASNKDYAGFMVYGEANIGGGFILPDSHTAQEQCKHMHCVPIKVKTLDEVMAQKKVDVLKIDAEGAEYWILEGATKLLANHNIMLILEWSNDMSIRNHIDPKAFIDLLQKNNFFVAVITNDGKLQEISYADLLSGASKDIVLARDLHQFKIS